ncbi:MAG: hypothetical protein R6T96_16620 [Longimicrobiales bacterium]
MKQLTRFNAMGLPPQILKDIHSILSSASHVGILNDITLVQWLAASIAFLAQLPHNAILRVLRGTGLGAPRAVEVNLPEAGRGAHAVAHRNQQPIWSGGTQQALTD